MAKLEQRFAEAEEALATLAEAIGKRARSLLERDGMILRLIYTFEAVWKTAQQLLAEREGIVVASPNATIRAARRVGWLSDEDARAAFDIGTDRNLAVHMYRGEIGEEIAKHLGSHVALLKRWLNALRERVTEDPGPSANYQLFEKAMAERKQILCTYDGYHRELCPVILGHTQGEEKALTYQFGGESKSGVLRGGQWKCLWLSGVDDVQLRDGPWHAGSRHSQQQTCVEIVDLDVNPDSPYNPKRLLSAISSAPAGLGREGKKGSDAVRSSRKKGSAKTARRK